MKPFLYLILSLLGILTTGCSKTDLKKKREPLKALSRIHRIQGIDYDHFLEYTLGNEIQSIKVQNFSGEEILRRVFTYDSGKLTTLSYMNRRVEYTHLPDQNCVMDVKDLSGRMIERHNVSFSNNKVITDNKLVLINNQWVSSSKTEYLYDSTGNLIEKQIYNRNANQWELYYSIKYQGYDNFINTSWHLQLKEMIAFPYQEKVVMGNPSKILYVTNEGKVLQELRYVYEYDSLKRKTKEIETHYMFDRLMNSDTSIFHYY